MIDDVPESTGRLTTRVAVLAGLALVTGAGVGAAIALAPDPTPPATITERPAVTAPAPPELGSGPDGAAAGAVGSPPSGPVTPVLSMGECVLDPHLNTYRTADGTWHFPGFTVVACEEPHFGEAYLVTSSALTDYDPWEAYGEADEACWAAFEAFVGTPYLDSALSFEPYYPSEPSWLAGERTIMCVVYGPSELVGSVAASGR